MVEGIENVIVSLYAKGISLSDIEEQIREVYNFDISQSTISRITDAITSDIVAWQNRPLEPVYLIVWMDSIVFKVSEGYKVINKQLICSYVYVFRILNLFLERKEQIALKLFNNDKTERI